MLFRSVDEGPRPERASRHVRRNDRAESADRAPAPLHQEPVGPRIDDGPEERVPADPRAHREGRVQAGRRPRDAALEGRDFITPDDVKRYANPVLIHRVILQPEYWMARQVTDDVIRDVLEKTPVPVVK